MSLARAGALTSDTAAITFGAAVPVLAAIHAPTAALAILGGLAALSTGVGKIFSWRRNWTEFANTLEYIDGQIALFDAGNAPYGSANRRRVLVANVERAVSSETGAWRTSAHAVGEHA